VYTQNEQQASGCKDFIDKINLCSIKKKLRFSGVNQRWESSDINYVVHLALLIRNIWI